MEENKEKNEETEKKEDKETEEESPIDKANKAAERLEKANAEQAKLLAKQEKILSEMKLQGRSFAGSQTKEQTQEEKIKEGALEFFKGSEIEKALKKHG